MSGDHSRSALLARGPWSRSQVRAHWSEDQFDPAPEIGAAADREIAALRERGSPSHDGLAARLSGWKTTADGTLHLTLQPIRWALRLVNGDASGSISALTVTRDSEGRWLAGRRAQWLATWAGRWTLGAGGAVDPGESPFDTLARELSEEWSVRPTRMTANLLLALPHHAHMFVGQAWLAAGAEIKRDHEHDEHAWWPADIADWPAEADDTLRTIAHLLT